MLTTDAQITAKPCARCGQTRPLDQFSRNCQAKDGLRPECKDCDRRYREAHRERLRAENRERMRNYREASPEQNRAIAQRHRDSNRELVRRQFQAAGRRYRAKNRAAVFAYYGEQCACCRSTEHLSIDHIDGSGRQHRIELFGANVSSDRMYRWLIRAGLPPGYQTLCMACNSSKRGGVRCRIDHGEVISA